MLSILINFIFTILTAISNIILTPLFALISVLIPSFIDFTGAMSQFLNNAFEYFMFIFKLFMIPQICITSIITLAFGYVTTVTIIKTYNFIVSTWKTLKP